MLDDVVKEVEGDGVTEIGDVVKTGAATDGDEGEGAAQEVITTRQNTAIRIKVSLVIIYLDTFSIVIDFRAIDCQLKILYIRDGKVSTIQDLSIYFMRCSHNCRVNWMCPRCVA